MAHTFARLRIADHIFWDRRQGLLRLRRAHLGRAGFAPLDDTRSFMKLSHLHCPSTALPGSHYFSYTPTMVYGGWQGEEVTSDSQMYIVLAANDHLPWWSRQKP